MKKTILLALFLIGGALIVPLSDAVGASGDNPASAIFGKWKGLYGHARGAGITVIEINLDGGDTPGLVKGHAKLYPGVGNGAALIEGQITEEDIVGRYDAPSRSLTLIVTHRQAGVIGPMAAAAIRAVFDPESGELLGVDGNLVKVVAALPADVSITQKLAGRRAIMDYEPFPFYVFARDAAGDHMVEKAVAIVDPPKPKPGSRTKPPAAGAQSGGYIAPSVDKIAAWASPLKQDDLVDPNNVQEASKQRGLYTSNLFAAEAFVPCFGKPYDQLTAEEIKAVRAQFFVKCPPVGSPPVAVSPLVFEYRNLTDLFDARSKWFECVPCSGPLVAAYWYRGIHRWITDAGAALKQMNADMGAFAKINIIEGTAACELEVVFPSEREALAKNMAETRNRIADPVLTDDADRIISTGKTLDDLKAIVAWPAVRKNILDYTTPSIKEAILKKLEGATHELADRLLAETTVQLTASASDMKGAHDLVDWKKKVPPEVMQYATDEDKAKAGTNIMARVDQLIGETLTAEAKTAAPSGSGLSAVIAGVRWFHHLSADYAWASERPPMEQVIKQLQDRRANDLASAGSDIENRIKGEKSHMGVESILQTYLGVPGDQSSATGSEIAALAQKRQAQIDRELYMALFSDGEKKLMDHDGHIVVPKDVPPPTSEEIRLALLRTLAMTSPDGKVLDPMSVRYTTVTASVFKTYAIVHYDKVELTGAPVPAAEGGYTCTYNQHLWAEWKSFLSDQTQVLPGAGGAPIDTNRFELGPDGWWSPTVRDRGIEVQTQDVNRTNQTLKDFFGRRNPYEY